MILLQKFCCSFRRSLLAAAVTAVAAVGSLLAAPAFGSVILSGTGLSASVPAVPLAAQAEFTLSGTTLSIVLSNISPNDSTSTDQMLSSFYFDIVKDGNRPNLTYASAEGFVWKLISNAPDEPFNYTPPAVAGGPGTYVLADGNPVTHVPSNLLADKANDRTWQFRDMNPAAAPFLGFGIGTVGNSLFGGEALNGFTPEIVAGTGGGPIAIAFSIYKNGDIQPVGAPVQNQFLVQNSATFTFTSPDLANYSLADISPEAAFGFGTGPDTVIVVPEPAALPWAVTGLGLAWLARRRRLATAVAVCLAAGGLAATARANTISTVTYDFATGPAGWVSTNAASDSALNITRTWTHVASEGLWRVPAESVFSSVWIANYLTSPLIEVPDLSDQFEVTILHRYQFQDTSTGKPAVLGQLAYRIFAAEPADPFSDPTPFVPLVLSSWTPPPDAVLPTYEVPAGLPPLLAGGQAFTGTSPGFSSNTFATSQAIIDGNLTPGTFVQLRLINGNIGPNCRCGSWDVQKVSVEAQLPEPEHGILAAAAVGAGGWSLLRRRHQRASRPREIPCTNTQPLVMVA